MASSINASTSGPGGVITTADNSGILNIQTANTTAIIIDGSQNISIGGTTVTGYKLNVTGQIGANGSININDSTNTNGFVVGRGAIYSNGSGGFGGLSFQTYNGGFANQVTIDGNGVFAMNSGYGSAATAYGCRAWVRFTGSSTAIAGSGGVSSVTRSSTGVYVVNFSFTFPDTNYATFVTDKMPASNNYGNYGWNNANTTNVTVYTNYNGTVYDAYGLSVCVFR